MRLVPVFILETHNQTNYKCWTKFVQTENASSNIKTAVVTKSKMNEHIFSYLQVEPSLNQQQKQILRIAST